MQDLQLLLLMKEERVLTSSFINDEGEYIMWTFFQDQIPGMKWQRELIGSSLSLMGLDVAGRML